MAKKAAAASLVNVGGDPRKDGGANGTPWFKIDPGQAIDIVPLVEADEILSCEQCAIWLTDGGKSPVWVYIGSDDPSHELTVQRRYRAFMPVMVLPEKEVQVLAMGKGLHGQILDAADGIVNIKGADMRLKRVGSGLQTRYSIVPKGTRTDIKRVPEVDVVSMLGPMDREGIEKLIVDCLGAPDYETILEKFKGKEITKRLTKPATTQQRGKHATTVAEDDDDEEDMDDVELS